MEQSYTNFFNGTRYIIHILKKKKKKKHGHSSPFQTQLQCLESSPTGW